ncbi:MAG TPA: exodeoxyribonuclease III [Solirubrobacteraceae bacterium]|jgi:exodeoxyribonuclease-3|nr:exodeoxyribonuclease III [Solirubrobacteraceae bacterium]
MRDEIHAEQRHTGRATTRRASHEHNLRVVSWNVNGIRARMPRIAELLRRERPDILCLQETRCPFRHFPHQRLQRLGYRAEHSPGRPNGGVAILVRSDHRVSRRTLALAGRHEMAAGRWLETTCAGLTLGTVYVPAHNERREHFEAGKLAFLEAVASQACRDHYHPLLITGDFNVAPSDRDVYEPTWLEGSSHTATAERVQLRQILSEGGLLDVYRHLHPEDRGYTCWDQRDGHYARDYGLRIDLALASSRLAEHIVRCEVKHAYRQGKRPSNHAPLEIELEGIGECEDCEEAPLAA